MKYVRVLRVVSFIFIVTTIGYVARGYYATALLAFCAAVVCNPIFIRKARLNKYVNIGLFLIFFLAAVYSVPYDHMEELIEQEVNEQTAETAPSETYSLPEDIQNVLD